MKMRLLTAAALAAMLAGPVSAQTTSGSTNTQGTTSGSSTGQGATSGSMGQGMSGSAGMQGQGGTTPAMTPACVPAQAGGAMGASMSGSADAGGAQGAGASGNMNAGGAMAGGGLLRCTSGDRVVTSNAPIPDSPSARAAYGGPESQGGRATEPRPGPVRKATRRPARRR